MEDDDTTEGDIWREAREESKKKRWANKEYSLNLLNSQGFVVLELNKEVAHYRIGDYDFWPTTGKFINRKTKESGRGVRNLVKKLKR